MKHSRAGYASYAGTPESAGGSWLSGFAGRTRRCRASATPRHLRPTPTFGHGAGRAELTTRRRTSSAANRQSADAHIQWKRLQRGGLRHVWRGEGVTPWSVRRTLQRLTPRTSLSSKPAGLVPRCLTVVARDAQRTQMLRRIRVRLTPRDQLTSGQREVVSHVRRTTAQHTPRVRVQVRTTDALPPRRVHRATT